MRTLYRSDNLRPRRQCAMLRSLLARSSPPNAAILPSSRRSTLTACSSSSNTSGMRKSLHILQVTKRHERALAVPPSLKIAHSHARTFHSTPRRSIPGCFVVLKTSAAIATVETAVKVSLTFLPVLQMVRFRSKKILYMVDRKIQAGRTDLLEKRERIAQRMAQSKKLFRFLLYIPAVLVSMMVIASLERTPITGRLRLILLSPEEEDEIAAKLAGVGWYQAVGEILSQAGRPQLVPPSDWRYLWVQDTLRRLESIIPILQHEDEILPDWMEVTLDGVPQPPPSEYPLRPRPKASEYFKRFADVACAREAHPTSHEFTGPPYSLIVIERPEFCNAFSYGFGPDGAGGIVVFSGFLDEILAKHSSAPVQSPHEEHHEDNSWWSSFLGSFLSLSPPPPAHPMPTEEQTSELAILLAHELAHLILAHHLETLSSGSIFAPGLMSILADVVRTLVFPITMLFGPFINDALASVGKASSGEFARLSEACTNQVQEIEADVVSARLLAHAGFDPRHAVQFWENRHEMPQGSDCSPGGIEQQEAQNETLQRGWAGSSHPVNVERLKRLKEELDRWEDARRKAREKRRVMNEQKKASEHVVS
ncbi:uncharacterized protein LAESUDRAFT_687669 [Laetiporus sulphureus 93-53]|uniref:Peptidase M48 domain-containing protein n=1 Tax=Laetiporus sulphureus 93-53 TaxID=1314785 RepID=A0A165BDJ0_9APHY|nr:uncharacterized protein LAESUDRAFT_687669 [Laetiporus sulphureus 93-53]KZT00806.1 hypothetical protein LAESUDRAFT_687669 [Laetiporus sulphureus 93-53]